MAYSSYPSTRSFGTTRGVTGARTTGVTGARTGVTGARTTGAYPQVLGGSRVTSPVATSPTLYSRAPRVSSGVTAASLVSPSAPRTTSFGNVASARTVQPASSFGTVSARSAVRPATTVVGSSPMLGASTRGLSSPATTVLSSPATTVLGGGVLSSTLPSSTLRGSPIISSPGLISQAKVISGGIQGISGYTGYTGYNTGYTGSAYAPTYYASPATGFTAPSSTQAAYEAKHADDAQLSNLKEVKRNCALKNVPIMLAAETFKAAAAGKGSLTRDEFFAAHAALLDSCGVPHPTPEVKDAVFDLFDRDDNGCIDMMELISGVSLLCYGNEDEKVEAVFLMFDENGDGYVSIDEMYKFLSTVFKIVCTPNVMDVVNQAGVSVANTDEMAKATTEECFQTADLNHDGKLSLDEFKKWFYAPRNDANLLFHPVKNMLDD